MSGKDKVRRKEKTIELKGVQ
jgi:hypothetical protein